VGPRSQGRGARGGGCPLGPLRSAPRPWPHHHRRGARGLLQAGLVPSLPCARGGCAHGPRARLCARARQRHALARKPSTLRGRQLPRCRVDARLDARTSWCRRASQGHHRRHGRAVPPRGPLGLLGFAHRRPRARGAASREGRPPAQPARLRELPHVPRVRVRARVPPLLHRPHVSRAHALADVSQLRSKLAREGIPRSLDEVPQLRESLSGRLRGGHAEGGGRAAHAPAR